MTSQNYEAKLLVVDDEPNIRELLSTSLRFAGFEVVAAANGREALEAAETHNPDLAVLDVMLPDMDGFTVTRKLRATGRYFPVVFLTARDDTEDKVTGLTVGGDDYVTKPFSLDEVVARIRAVLRRTAPAEDDDAILVVDDLELDDDAHEVRRGGEVVDLSILKPRHSAFYGTPLEFLLDELHVDSLILTGLQARGRSIQAVTRLGFPYDRWQGSTRTVPDQDDVEGIVYHRLLDDRRRYPQHPLTDYVGETADGVERVARAQRAAIIHASSFYVAGMAGLTAARRLGMGVVQRTPALKRWFMDEARGITGDLPELLRA